MTGYNWRNTLTEYAAKSGLLAGFSVVAITLILGGSLAEFSIFFGVTFSHISICFFGISTSLFITSAELFLRAKSFDHYEIPKRYLEKIEKSEKIEKNLKRIYEISMHFQ